MSAKFTRLVLPLTVALFGCMRAFAQVPDWPAIHRSAVDVYVQTRDVTRAVVPLTGFSPQNFDRAIEALVATQNAARMRAAAVLHLDIAVALVGLSPGSAKFHLDIGESLGNALEELHKRGGRVDELQTFRAMWSGVAGSVFLAVKDVQRGMPYVRHAKDLAPKSAHVMTLFGIANEVDAGGWNPNDWQTLTQRDRNTREWTVRLGAAERAYREAIRIDDGYALASIRLGHVLHLQRHTREAREALERGLALATALSDQYAGALFLGAVLQEQGDVAGARRSYERALSLAPSSQPAVVALAHLELMEGRPDRARDIAERFASVSAEDTWWAFKDGALDISGLTWLRAQVRP